MVKSNLDPEIILVKTQIPENLGFIARCMLNFEMDKLRIVSPKFNLDNEKIIPLSAGAQSVIKKAKIYNTFEDSIKDFNFLIACSARKRSLKKIEQSPEESIKEIYTKIIPSNKVGFIFGPESSGLSNNNLKFVNRVINIKTNEEFPSINLSHSVMIICYEWYKFKSKIDAERKTKKFVYKYELMEFFQKLEELLKKSGFVKTDKRQEIIFQKIRNIFDRVDLDSNEIKILFGIITSLYKTKNFK